MTPVLTTSLVQAIYAYALMAVIAIICAGVIKLIVSVLARSTKTKPATVAPAAVGSRPAPAKSAASVAAPAPESDELAVIIAAACHAVVGTHRIVYLAETSRAANWTSEMRSRHHLSHVPHR